MIADSFAVRVSPFSEWVQVAGSDRAAGGGFIAGAIAALLANCGQGADPLNGLPESQGMDRAASRTAQADFLRLL